MLDDIRAPASVILVVALALAAGPATAQSRSGGKIVCWKDGSGKTIGCGDSVPPEYRNSATKELDRHGVTRKTTESALEADKHRAQQQELARQKAEEQKKLAEQKRQDAALLNTYTSAKEIDFKRDRDMQAIELQIGQLKGSLKNTTSHQAELQARVAGLEKSAKPVPAGLKDEIERAAADRQKAEQSIAAKEDEKTAIRARYEEYKKRFVELKGGPPPAAAPAPASAAGAKK